MAHAVASRREAGQHALHGQAVKHLDRGEELVAWQGKLAVGAGRAYPRALHDQAPAAEGDAARLAAVTVARTSLVVLALGPAEALHVLGEHRLHDLQAGAHGESQQALLGRGGDPTQADRQLLGQLDLDAGVRGVHLIALLHGGLPLVELLCGCPTPTTGRHQAGDRHPSSSTTFGTSSRAAEFGCFDIIAHLDYIALWGHRSGPGAHASIAAALDAIAASGAAIELNTDRFSDPAGVMYPSDDLLRAAADRGITLVLGSDAHEAAHVGRAWSEAMERAVEAGFSTALRLSDRRLAPLPEKPGT